MAEGLPMGKVAFERCRLLWLIVKDRDTVIDRDVVIRVLSTNPGATPGDRRRLHHETHAAARLAGPRIISIDDTGKICGQPYFAMPTNEVRILQEFCKTPAATYLRERPGRCHHTAVKAPPPPECLATKGARK